MEKPISTSALPISPTKPSGELPMLIADRWAWSFSSSLKIIYTLTPTPGANNSHVRIQIIYI
jgi:hypothetical protein